jgi:hypothetical protein
MTNKISIYMTILSAAIPLKILLLWWQSTVTLMNLECILREMMVYVILPETCCNQLVPPTTPVEWIAVDSQIISPAKEICAPAILIRHQFHGLESFQTAIGMICCSHSASYHPLYYSPWEYYIFEADVFIFMLNVSHGRTR